MNQFWTPKNAPGRQKSLQSIGKIVVHDFALLVRIASRPGFGTLPGFILKAFWLPDGSNMASKAPKTAPRRPMGPPRRLLHASRDAPGAPRTPPGWPPGRPGCLPGSPRASKTAPGASKAPLGALQGRLLDRPSCLQELFRGAFQASSCCLAGSSHMACRWPRWDARSVNNSAGIFCNSLRSLRISVGFSRRFCRNP